MAFKTRVQLTVCNSVGEVIEILIDEVKKPGTYEVEFSTCHSRKSAVGGGNLSEGIYFYRLEAGDYRSEKKMVLQK